MPFTKEDLQKAVSIVGDAFKFTDAHIANGKASRPILYDNKRPSGPRLSDEMYYEHISAKSLIMSFYLRVVTSVRINNHHYDLGVFETKDDDSLVALGEIKCWWEVDKKEQKEILHMKEDIKRLMGAPCSSFYLIITASYKGKIEETFQLLNKLLELEARVTQ